MSLLKISPVRRDARAIGVPQLFPQTTGFAPASKDISERLSGLARPTSTFAGQRPGTSKTIEEQLYDTLADFKVRTNQVAMHLDHDWQSLIFGQLDNLLASEDWQREDRPPTLESFATFLRALLLLRPQRRPGLGATADGILIATWTTGDDRLNFDCLPKDMVRWHLSVTIDGERERAAGLTPLARLAQALNPYDTGRWFRDANLLSA